MARPVDPYEHMSDAELDAHVASLVAAPAAEHGTANVVISLRMPQAMLDGLRAAADARGEGYQTLMKRWLGDRLAEDAGVEPPPDWDAMSDDVVAGVVLTPGQIRTLATRGELIFRVRTPTRRPSRPARKAVAPRPAHGARRGRAG